MSKPQTQSIPRYRTASHHICQAIYEHGKPVTMLEGIGLHGYKGQKNIYLMKKLYQKAVDNGWLVEENGKYYVSRIVSNYFDGFTSVACKHADLVKPRYIPQTTEMKPVPRDPRLRKISFVTLGSSLANLKLNGVEL